MNLINSTTKSPLTVVVEDEVRLLGNVSWGNSRCVVDGYPSASSRNADPIVNELIRTTAGL